MKKLVEIALMLLMGNNLLTTNGLQLNASVLDGSLLLLKDIATSPDIFQSTCEICKSGNTNQSIEFWQIIELCIVNL